MNDDSILSRIHSLIEREHLLRSSHEDDTADAATRSTEIRDIEVELDQCWDLLRQRRAKRDYGDDADGADVRPPSTVEHYLQ